MIQKFTTALHGTSIAVRAIQSILPTAVMVQNNACWHSIADFRAVGPQPLIYIDDPNPEVTARQIAATLPDGEYKKELDIWYAWSPQLGVLFCINKAWFM